MNREVGDLPERPRHRAPRPAWVRWRYACLISWAAFTALAVGWYCG